MSLNDIFRSQVSIFNDWFKLKETTHNYMTIHNYNYNNPGKQSSTNKLLIPLARTSNYVFVLFRNASGFVKVYIHVYYYNSTKDMKLELCRQIQRQLPNMKLSNHLIGTIEITSHGRFV